MKHADFVHLHNHSDYSMLDGASTVSRMVERAAELHMPALALTDHGSMFGAVEFYLAASKAGLKPIVGMEAYVTRGRRQDRSRDSVHHLTLLARDETGFRNLMRLSSLAYLEGFYYKPRVDHELLERHAEGLLALSGCPQGELASAILADDEEEAVRTAQWHRDLFGPENYFLEIMNHGLDIEDRIRARMRALSERVGVPLVATNDNHYLDRDHTEAQEILLCIQTGKTMDDPKRMRALANLHFRTPEEMQQAFADFPDAVRNTVAVAERCNLQMTFGRPLLPAFPLPEGETSPDDYLRRLAWAELPGRVAGVTDEVRKRFDYELDVICRMGFASYFLIVRDFITFAREHGIGVGPGRGSVAGSLVAYVLHITEIDPLVHGLIFERFLNPERVTMPDIDIDFDDLRRPEVIEYVRRKYGEGCVTQIITFGTMGAKGVLRDVGRALGLPFADVDRVARMVPDGVGMTLEQAFKLSPDLKNLPERGEPYARLIRNARVLEGVARHASTHAAGVLITPGPLLDYVPLYRQRDESVTTQWDMKSVEKVGLLKMDFLGLRTLSVLEESVRLIAEKTGERLELTKLPMDDADTYALFQRADTVAIFQFESTGMRDYLRKLKPTVFEDLVAMNALYRPGPMENIPYFIDCKHGRQVVRYEHQALEPILKKTYGVFIYQEQVMEAAHRLAGFSLAQADELRRAMGKKMVSEMEKKQKAFLEGCTKNRIPAAKAIKIFQTMEKFAGYGFNASHAAAYALIAYQCAWLKAHHPAEFMAATLTSEMADSSRIVTLIAECRAMGLTVRPPDVNRSEWRFSIEEGAVRIGLGAVRNVGQGAVEGLLAARRGTPAEGVAAAPGRAGPFRDLFDLAHRAGASTMNRRVLESLVAAGACDELGAERGRMFAGAGRVLEQAAALQRDRARGQSSLFGEEGQDDGLVTASELPPAPAWSTRERSAHEKEVLGLYFSEHPLEPLRGELERLATHTVEDLPQQPHGTEVRIGGVLGELRSINTRNGKLMAAAMLEDLTGRIECTLFPDLYEQVRPWLAEDEIVVISGRVEIREERGAKLVLTEVRRLEEARAVWSPTLHIEVVAASLSVEWLEEVDVVLSAHPGDSEVYLHLVLPNRERKTRRSRRYRVAGDSDVAEALRHRFPGVRAFWGKGVS
jgi:DNA polymerase III subunit alpha